jgi:hypothetical protein
MKSEFKDLLVTLTAEQRQEMAQKHVETSDLLAETEAEKKRAMAGYKEKIDSIKDTERRQRKAHLTGVLEKRVMCREVPDLRRGVAYWIRDDTGEPERKLSKGELHELRLAEYNEQQEELFQKRDEAEGSKN